jgi:hypothetical protein
VTDIDKERDRLDQVSEHIEEAEQKARDILKPQATPDGVPRTLDDDEPEA